MDCCSCNCGRRKTPHRSHSHPGEHKMQDEASQNDEAASPLAPGDRYPQPHHQHQHKLQQQSTSSESGNRTPFPSDRYDPDHNQVYRVNHHYHQYPSLPYPPNEDPSPPTNSPKPHLIMTGNGFFVASSGGSALAKSKSGTVPDNRYSSPQNPTPRGFRDTFVSSMASPPPRSSDSASPHRMRSASSGNRNSSPAKESSTTNNNTPAANGNKKWSFGGLFKRKVKTNNGTTNATPTSNINSQSPTGFHHQRNSSPMSAGGSMSHSSPSPSFAPQSGNASSFSTHPHYANPHVQQLNTHVHKGNQSPSTIQHHLRRSSNSGGGSSSGPVANGNKYVSTPTQTRHKVKLSESDITSDDSELEVHSQTQSQTQQPASFKQNFLTRRLSRRKEKAAAKKKAAAASPEMNGLLKVPQLNNGKRVGSSPESLNNGNNTNNIFSSSGPWPSWEITKKVPQLQAVNNYSSSGSLSLSQEGSSKGSRAAAKEAVKARAVARRESFIQDSSSEDEDRSHHSSIQGSHSSLTPARGNPPPRKLRPNSNIINSNQLNNNYPSPQGQPFRPVVVTDYVTGRGSAPSSPAKFDRHNNNSSPSLQTQRKNNQGSPRWEARVVYTQENHENETPFIVKLPSNRGSQPQRPPSQLSAPTTTTYVMEDHPVEDHQQIITAGLRVPIAPGQSGQSGGQITEEVHYANLPNGTNNNAPRFRSATPINYPIVNASPPPPPPPRREYSRLLPNNQNFYRPVSCSYLDSYNHHQAAYYSHQQNPVRNASPIPNINGMNATTSFANGGGSDPRGHNYYDTRNHPQPQPQVHLQQQPHHNGNYYYTSDQVDNARAYNNFLTPKHHPSLIRSPSEPPEIKVQYARRESPVRRNASTPTPALHPHYYYYNNNQDHNDFRQPPHPSQAQAQQAIITSKLGFPVRKLNDAGKIPLAQSPVHMRASEFWRKKEAEVTGNPVGPNPNHRRYMNRIRSADSSPLPVHRMRNSPAAILQNSNESISSLSSFSAEAQSPHIHMFGAQVPGQRMVSRKIQNSGGDSSHGHNSKANNSLHGGGSGYNATVTTTITKPIDNFGNTSNYPLLSRQESGLSKSDREKTPQQTACERLKVRNPSAPETKEDSNKLRSLVELNNGKTNGRNLEDALNELEDMYKSLKLSDEDLLDRAERRDLPTPHQELRNAPLIPLPASYQNQAFRYSEALGSVESLATGSSTGSGTNYSSDNPNRVRAPPLRRSSRPDTVQDDMARRRFDSSGQQETKPLDPRNVVSQTGSYMVLSPAFSPPASPCPPETLPLSFTMAGWNVDEPDLTLDDVTFRQYRKANSIRIIDPQPKFGIPLGPITTAPGTDYLHSKRSDRLRPLFRATKNPDLVNDDIAFRNLRKDLNSDNNNLSKDWTPRLFSPTRDNTFNFGNTSTDQQKKLRAIRSLSANVTNYIPFMDHSFNNMSEAGKWNSFTDLHHQGRSVGTQPQRASTYWGPSWVEQVEKVQSSERLRGSNNKFPSEPEEYWERKLPSKTVELTPDLYDPTKSRRPWTDIILESFEKEKQAEMERLAAEAAATAGEANANVNSNSINDTTMASTHPNNCLEITEELDDDVFLDARDKSKSTSPENRKTQQCKMLANYANFKTSEATTTTPTTTAADFPLLLPGTNTRRGSWVEPRTSSSYLSASDYNSMVEQDDRRRKSWSDIPKDHENLYERNKLFNPLPPPRKIKQINLDQFNSQTSNPIDRLSCKEFEAQQKTRPRILSGESIQRRTKGEEELNALMDMLIREADSCGPEPANISSAKTTHVNVSLSDEGVETPQLRWRMRESESNQIPKHSTSSSIPLGMTQKDSSEHRIKSYIQYCSERNLMPVPKIPQKESQFDEPTKTSCTDDNNISKQRAALLQEPTAPEPPPEIVAVSRKHSQRHDEQETTAIKRNDYETTHPTTSISDDTNLSPNYTTCSPITSSSSVIVNPKSNENDPFISSTHEGILFQTDIKSSPCRDPSSIDELIDSINESLPELETHGEALSSFSTKSNGSSLSSTGSASPPSVPSPRPGSPTTITLMHRHHSSTSSSTSTHTSPEELEHDSIIISEEKLQDDETTLSPNNNTRWMEKVEGDDNDEAYLSRRRSSTNSSHSHTSEKAGPSGLGNSAKEEEEPRDKSEVTNEPRKSHENVEKVVEHNFPFLRNSAKRSQSQSQVGKSVSSFPTTGSESGDDGKRWKEKDKSHKRKSHLNRAFTDEPVPNHSSSFHPHSTINTSCEIKTKTKTISRECDGAGEPSVASSFSVADYHEEKDPSTSKKSSTSIYKVPPIPSILTTNNHTRTTAEFNANANCNRGESGGSSGVSSSRSNNRNGMSKSPDNSISSRQLPPSPSLKLKSSTNILNKVQTFQPKSSMVKPDSFSDAEGVSFIKKLLQKESMVDRIEVVKQKDSNQQQQPFVLKKSPSAGSTHSKYFSKYSNGQPIFFKKFFEKGNNRSNTGAGRQVEDEESKVNAIDENENHEKLRKDEESEMKNSSHSPDSNANITTTISTNAGVGGSGVRNNEESSTKTNCSVAQKASFFMKLEHDQRFSKWRKNSLDGSSSPFPKINPTPATIVVPSTEGSRSRSRQLTQPITTTEVQLAAENAEVVVADADTIEAKPKTCSGAYDTLGAAGNSREPYKLSLKDRVHMFDKLIAVGGKPPCYTPLPLPLSGASNVVPGGSKTGFPVIHSSSAVMPSSVSLLMPIKVQPNKVNTIGSKNSAFFTRRGSTSDIELNHNPPKHTQTTSKRSSRTRSMYVKHDELSGEDGEFSSGGQEVAEIISRSYENSPVARKKSLKSQKQPQTTLTKEIWRRSKVNENNANYLPSPAQFPQQTYKVTTKLSQAIIAEHLDNNTVISNEPTNLVDQGQRFHSSNSCSSPPTSNLLQILTVLNSSNDEQDENNRGVCSRRMRPQSEQFGNQRSVGPTQGNITDNGSSISVADNLNSSRVPVAPHQVYVPNPDDESFQLFFGKSVTQALNSVSILANDAGSCESGINLSSSESQQTHSPKVDAEMNLVQRESDLLVMKKNVPLLRRKSSAKSRNPLKALAARIDFRNQSYTEHGCPDIK